MKIITDKAKIFFQQRDLEAKLNVLLSNTQIRKANIVLINDPIKIHCNTNVRKWFYYQDNFADDKYTFFFGKWTTGGGPLECDGSISISYVGDTKNAGVFAESRGEIYLLHSGRMGHLTREEFFNKFTGTTTPVVGTSHDYAIVSRMSDPNLANNAVNFF